MIEKASASATYGGSALAFFGGLSANEIAAYGGLIIAVIGFVSGFAANIWYKLQLLKIAREHGLNAGSGDD